ncbi:MAG: Hpt domain-containing protein, partial [Sphingobium sp.]
MDELLEQFLIEGRELVADAHDALAALGRDGNDRASLDVLFRAMHTLKGSVALFDMAPAETLLHAAETLLARARRDETGLDGRSCDALVAVVDQVDRWADAMESAERLPMDAAAVARDLILSLDRDGADGAKDEPSAPRQVAASDDWLASMLARPQFAGVELPVGGTAFRYRPDPECFFRGDDPLATVAATPGVIRFALLADQDRPSLEDFDPFRCCLFIEGISTAAPDDVRTAFRMVPDQIDLLPLGGSAITAGAEASSQGEGATVHLRVEGAKLDRLARHVGELSVALHGLSGLADRVEVFDRALGGDLRRAQAAVETVSDGLRTAVADVRLVSLSPILRRLPRLAREVAAALGKDIAFHISGDATQADKQVADALFEPLLHLVRNSIDHGIESAETRRAAGTPVQGQVSLAIRAEGERLRIL